MSNIIVYSGVPGAGKTLNAVKALATEKRLKEYQLTPEILIDAENNKRARDKFPDDEFATAAMLEPEELLDSDDLTESEYQVYKDACKDEDGKPIFSQRPVFYYNIRNVKKELGWQKLSLRELEDWHVTLPHGSVILVDEAQDVFKVLKSGSNRPEHYTQLHTVRHRAIIFILITQHPSSLDFHVRKLIGEHHHFHPKPTLSRSDVKKSVHLKFNQLIDDPSRFYSKKFCEMNGHEYEVISLDKSYFGYYASPSIHNEKPPVSKVIKRKIALLLLPLLVLPIAAFFFLGALPEGPQTAENINVDDVINDLDSVNTSMDALNTKITDLETYLKSYQPLTSVMPWSAPIYEDSFSVSHVPQIDGCFYLKYDGVETCYCETQQATKIYFDTVQECKAVLDHGIFQPHLAASNNDAANTNARASSTSEPDGGRPSNNAY